MAFHAEVMKPNTRLYGNADNRSLPSANKIQICWEQRRLLIAKKIQRFIVQMVINLWTSTTCLQLVNRGRRWLH